jgi:hypothetical protein
MQSTLWTSAASCIALAGIAILSDRRRQKRRDLDRVGWVPWPTILIFALFGAAVCAALAINSP